MHSAPAAVPVTDSPPRVPPIKYTAPLGTRWAKEKAAAGGAAAFDLPTDPKNIGPWILGECVGKGASGRVKIAKHRRTGQLAAVKILPVAPLVSSRASLTTQKVKSDRQRLGIDREITMMKLMNHPNIMRIYDVYEGEKELFLVLEYVEGGELFDFLVNRGRLPPNEALIYFRQIVYGLNYAHTFSIIHRDLKPENILIASLSPPQLKIADWGMAAFAPPSLQLETSCGSPHYASPEIVNGEKYEGNATDIWSCGVILYALLTGRLPFDDKNVRTLLSKVKSGKYEMPTWIDPMAKDLLSKMLVVDVKQRITIPEILAHPWLMTHQVISFTDTAGHIYAIHAPPLPPSPTLLGRPIFFPSSKTPSDSRSVNNTLFSVSPTPFNTNSSIHAQSLPQTLTSSDPQPDPELLASLHIIWGRHADPSGEAILRELCAPSGEGVHAKAFYFLLGKYREERGRYREENWLSRNVGAGDIIDLETLKFDLGWELEEKESGGLRKYEVLRSSQNRAMPVSQPSTTSSNVSTATTALATPSYSSNLSSGPPPGITGRDRMVTDSSLTNLPLTPPINPESEHTPSKPNTNNSTASPQTPLTGHYNANAQVNTHIRTKISLGQPSVPRPAPRRGVTYSGFEGRTNENVASAIGFSQHLQHMQVRSASGSGQRSKPSAVHAAALSSSPPGTDTDVGAGRKPLSPILSPRPNSGASRPAGYSSTGSSGIATQSANLAQNQYPSPSTNSGGNTATGANAGSTSTSRPGASEMISVGSLDLPLLTASKMRDVQMQRTMNGLTQKVNDLVQSVMQAPAPHLHGDGHGNISNTYGHANENSENRDKRDAGKNKADNNKENHTIDEESWNHVGGDADKSMGAGLGVSVDLNVGGNVTSGGVGGNTIGGNRDVGRDVANVGTTILEPAKMKKDKERKARPPPLELPAMNHKRSTFAMLGSPIALSSPTHHPHQPSSANRILASPVVGEFKGWFSSLFNWKNSSAHGGLLYSADDIHRTRSSVAKVLEVLGVTITNTPGEFYVQEQAEILFCCIDQPTVDRETGVAMKVVRFRVEFRAASPQPQPQKLATPLPSGGDDTPASAVNAYFLNTPCIPSPLVTPTSATGSSSRTRTSILLGRASTHSSTSQSTTMSVSSASGSSGAANSRMELPPGCLCAVALVHEKGSMSTFKHVWRRLKEECAGGADAETSAKAQAYACFSPAMPGTPFVENQRMGM